MAASPLMAYRILLVEDDPSIRELTTIGLRAAGYEVVDAADGRQALDRFASERPMRSSSTSCCRCWTALPCAAPSASESAVPIIMLTARTDAFDVVAGLRPAPMTTCASRSNCPSWSPGCASRSAARARPRPAGSLRLGPLEIDEASHTVPARRATRSPSATPSSACSPSLPPPRPGLHAGAAPRTDLGLRLPWRFAPGRRRHPAAAGQGRGEAGAPRADPHRPRSRLQGTQVSHR